jgi:hypothetical protein
MDTIKIMKPVFIIAHKYFRGYQSYLKHYVDNILKFYGDNSLILIVDNNSNYPQDIFDTLPIKENIKILTNNIDCKFELGAYQVGIKYILEHNLLDLYDYYICTQDNFIIKNKLDLDDLYNNEVYSCPINSFYQDGGMSDISNIVLDRLGLNNNLDKVTFCWCCSFITHRDKIKQLYSYLIQIRITRRVESEAAERYLARIIWELNNYKNNDIDGDIRTLKERHYYCWTVDPLEPTTSFFVKKVQQKTENTSDLL